MTSRSPLIINRLDAERLQRLIDETDGDAVTRSLETTLQHGEVLDPKDIPANVISMNSQVRFTDLASQREIVQTLVYPHALATTEDGVSVMAAAGAALLGLHVGAALERPLPGESSAQAAGETSSALRVDAILWQPEREGQFHR